MPMVFLVVEEKIYMQAFFLIQSLKHIYPQFYWSIAKGLQSHKLLIVKHQKVNGNNMKKKELVSF